MLKSYGGFFESSDGLVPAPGACHPALVSYHPTLLASTRGEFRVDYLSFPYGSSGWPVLKSLHFHRGLAYGNDMFGNNWVWPVYMDQFGRSAGGEAALWNTFAT